MKRIYKKKRGLKVLDQSRRNTGESRNKWLQIRVNKEEKESVEHSAQKEYKTVSKYLLDVHWNYIQKCLEYKQFKKTNSVNTIIDKAV